MGAGREEFCINRGAGQMAGDCREEGTQKEEDRHGNEMNSSLGGRC